MNQSRRCDNHSSNAWTGLMDTAISEPVNTEKNEITESVSALGIHHRTPLAEEMVEQFLVRGQNYQQQQAEQALHMVF